MDYPKFIASNKKEESISIQRVNARYPVIVYETLAVGQRLSNFVSLLASVGCSFNSLTVEPEAPEEAAI